MKYTFKEKIEFFTRQEAFFKTLTLEQLNELASLLNNDLASTIRLLDCKTVMGAIMNREDEIQTQEAAE